MYERRIIHLIRYPSGAIDSTARGVSKEAADSWESAGAEVFCVEIQLPFEIGVPIVLEGKVVNG